ncbi:WD40 repeat protein 2 [Pelomyxa schiedti]|nr:WD40 repeat protein 2 [Pelomyxa schiedti]
MTTIALQHIFAPSPATKRGSPVILGAEPKAQTTVVYATGTAIIIRSLVDLRSADMYFEHPAQTTCAKYAPTGFYIASGDVAGNIRIWDTTQREHPLKLELKALSGPINDIVWSPDSKHILAVGDGKERFGNVFMWDAGSTVGEITGHSKCLMACDYRPARPFKIVTGGEDAGVNFFDGPPFRFKKAFKEHTRFVNALKFSPDGSKFISASSDKKVFIFDGKTGDKLAEAETVHKLGVYAAAWSPDGTQFMTASADKTVIFWDAASGRPVKVLTCGTEIEAQQLGCLWLGKHIVSVNLEGDINLLDPSADAPVAVIRGHNKFITAMCQHEGNFFTGSYDGRILMWRGATGENVAMEGKGHTNQIAQILVDTRHPNPLLVTCAMDDSVRFTPLDTRRYGEAIGVEAPCTGIALAGAAETIVATVKSIAVIRGGVVVSNMPVAWGPGCVTVNSVSGDIAVGGRDDRKVHIFTLAGDSLVEKGVIGAENIRGAVQSIAYSPNGQLLATADTSRNIIIWDAATNAVRIEGWVFHTARVNHVAWSADSMFLASGGLDSSLYVWSIANPTTRLFVKTAHFNGVNVCAWVAPNLIATVGQDCALKTWLIS